LEHKEPVVFQYKDLQDRKEFKEFKGVREYKAFKETMVP
jgi:predicted RNA-binding protein with PUA-like domain